MLYLLKEFKYWIDDKIYEWRYGVKRIEVWDLRGELSKWVLPRLKLLYETRFGYPPNITNEQWGHILKEMVDGFELLAKDDIWSPEKFKKAEKAIKLFGNWYLQLWD